VFLILQTLSFALTGITTSAVIMLVKFGLGLTLLALTQITAGFGLDQLPNIMDLNILRGAQCAAAISNIVDAASAAAQDCGQDATTAEIVQCANGKAVEEFDAMVKLTDKCDIDALNSLLENAEGWEECKNEVVLPVMAQVEAIVDCGEHFNSATDLKKAAEALGLDLSVLTVTDDPAALVGIVASTLEAKVAEAVALGSDVEALKAAANDLIGMFEVVKCTAETMGWLSSEGTELDFDAIETYYNNVKTGVETYCSGMEDYFNSYISA